MNSSAKLVDAVGVAVEIARQLVVGDHRRDRGDQAERGREQRLGDARRDHRERGVLGQRDRLEAVHDAPDRAEQADERRGRADRRERAQMALEPLELALEGQRHHLADPLEQARARGARRRARRLAPLLHRRGEQQRHRVVGLAAEPAVEVVERRARPEGALERRAPCGAARPRPEGLVEDHRPAPDRGEHQQRHHHLDDDVGLDDQRPQAEADRSSPARLTAVTALSSIAQSHAAPRPPGGPGGSPSDRQSVRPQPTFAAAALSQTAVFAAAESAFDSRCQAACRPAGGERCSAARSAAAGGPADARPSSASRSRGRTSGRPSRGHVAARARARRRPAAAAGSRPAGASSSRAGARKSARQRRTAKARPKRARSVRVVEPEAAQHLGPRPLGELQVVGVVDDAAGIGVLVVDPQRQAMDAGLDPAGSAVGAVGLIEQPGLAGRLAGGGSSRRCRQASRVSSRPRGVRCSRPCCSRNGSTTSSSVSRCSDSAAASVSTPTGPPP